MPYPNYHACRIREPGLFDKIRAIKQAEKESNIAQLLDEIAVAEDFEQYLEQFDQVGMSLNGTITGEVYEEWIRELEEQFVDNRILVIIGRLKSSGKWVTQAIRYPKETWPAERARASCSRHGGKFEEASEKNADERFELRTETIDEVDLMGPGTWNGIPFKKEDLIEVVSNFGKLKDRVKAWLALGHSGKLGTRQRSGMPAVGWIDRIWWDEKTQRLKGRFTDVPKKLAELIKAKAYRRVSVEYIRNFLDAATGKRYNRVMVGCALLGTEIPAVTTNRTLDQVRALYTGDEYEHEVIEWFENLKGGDEMPDNDPKIEALEEKLGVAKKALQAAETFIRKVLEKFGDIDQDELLSAVDSLVKERDDFKAKIEKNEAEIREGKIDALFTKVSGKLLPKEEEMYREMLNGVEGIEALEAKIKELTEMFEAKESLKRDERAEHDNTGEQFRHDHGRSKDNEDDIKDAEEAEEFVSDIEHELKEKGITDALDKESKEEFVKQYSKTETT